MWSRKKTLKKYWSFHNLGLRTAFKFFDKDTDGGINAVELDRVLGELGESTTVAECEKMIAEVDSDGKYSASVSIEQSYYRIMVW